MKKLIGTLNERFVLILTLLLIFSSRIITFFTPILNIDESDFAVQTAVWLNKGIPYIDFVEKKPILIHMAYAIPFHIFGVWNMTAVHIFFALIVMTTGLIIYATVSKISGKQVGIIAILIFAVYQAGYDTNDFLAANTETLMNFFSGCTVFFLVLDLCEDKNKFYLLLSGVFLGLAILSKQVAIALLPPMIISLIVKEIKTGKIRAILTKSLLLSLGLLIPFLVLFAYLYYQGALGWFYRWVWVENIKYASNAVPFLVVLMHGINGINRIGVFMLAFIPLWILTIIYAIRIIRNRDLSAINIFLFSWLIFCFPAVSLGGRFFPHYFLQFLLPLTIISALAWHKIITPISERSKLIDFASLAIVIIIPYLIFFALHFYEIQNKFKFVTEKLVGKTIASLAAPSDRIFVWGHSSDIYYYSKRLPSSRFIYCSYLTGANEGFENIKVSPTKNINKEAWKLLMEDLANKKPKWVVDMSGTKKRGYNKFPISSYSELDNLIKNNYSLALNIKGSHIFSLNK